MALQELSVDKSVVVRARRRRAARHKQNAFTFRSCSYLGFIIIYHEYECFCNTMHFPANQSNVRKIFHSPVCQPGPNFEGVPAFFDSFLFPQFLFEMITDGPF